MQCSQIQNNPPFAPLGYIEPYFHFYVDGKSGKEAIRYLNRIQTLCTECMDKRNITNASVSSDFEKFRVFCKTDNVKFIVRIWKMNSNIMIIEFQIRKGCRQQFRDFYFAVKRKLVIESHL